jgi:cytochrome c-type biogenesis protein CcmH/NrfF
MDRRAALRALALGAPLLAQQGTTARQDSSLTKLAAPDLAGRSQSEVTPFDNNPDIVAIEQKLKCTCGCDLSVYSCRTTDFSCMTSPAMHRMVIRLYQDHQTAEQILAAFVAKDGDAVLMAPPRTGFNLVGYYLPGALIAMVGASLLFFFYSRRARVVAASSPGGSDGTGAGLSATDAALLADELKNLDR